MAIPLAATAVVAAKALKRNAPRAIVRASRFFYVSSVGVIGFAAITAWKNQQGDESFLETLRSRSWTPERSFKKRGGGKVGADGQVKTGSGINGTSQEERFSKRNYQERLNSSAKIARYFGLVVTSNGRTDAENAAANGVPTSLHLFSRGALAFDFGGSVTGESRLYDWASTRSDLFQEVMWHDAGSGLHVHIAFKPGVTRVESFATGPMSHSGASL